ncbi:MAG: tetratricopeptide repeat protein [Candidatus Hydrogenedentes bacterium]|nr:tetratricopeptide repeat protein [Candidatus Hydrogenedentota bacterium]
MAKGITGSAKTYVTNLGRYVRRLVQGEASTRSVLAGVARDTKKLTYAVRATVDDEDERDGKKLTELGRRAYNEKDYKVAENLFKRANLADPKNALALTYLGHTAYKQGNAHEAVNYWKRAILTDPNSTAADKAREKLAHTEKQTRGVVEQMEQRLKE